MGEKIENPQFVDYADIPDFPVSTAPGHVGRFVANACASGQGCQHCYQNQYRKTGLFHCISPKG